MTRLLLASDFDGTLAPIERRPEDVCLDPAARHLFETASALDSIDVAFLSGRDLDDLTARTAGIRAWRSGSHGREISDPAGRIFESGERLRARPDPRWIEEARKAGIRLEEKRHGVAAHWRGSNTLDRGHPLVRAFADWAIRAGLDLVDGRCVLEARTPGPSKRDALADLAAKTNAERVVFAGDDLTDFPALEWAAKRGRGLLVRSPERAEQAPEGVETVGSLRDLLGELETEVASLARDIPLRK